MRTPTRVMRAMRRQTFTRTRPGDQVSRPGGLPVRGSFSPARSDDEPGTWRKSTEPVGQPPGLDEWRSGPGARLA
jgi:hypothetical protein